MSIDSAPNQTPTAVVIPRLTVGYLATPSGADGVALAVALARATGAIIDIVCVIGQADHLGHPGRSVYQRRVEDQAGEWLADAAKLVPDDIEVRTIVRVDESFTEGLIAEAQAADSRMIVVGGTRDGLVNRHALGTVSTELLHSSPLPVALAPRGYAQRSNVLLDMVTVAVPTKPKSPSPLPYAVQLAEKAGLDMRLLSLVTSNSPIHDDSNRDYHAATIENTRTILEKTRSELPPVLEVDVAIADGSTLDEALGNLAWDQNDLVAVGSGHLGPKNRVFLGSTAARILRWTTAPIVVVPKD